MKRGFSAQFQPANAIMTVRDDFLSRNSRTMRFHERFFLFRRVFEEKSLRILQKSFRSELRIARRLRLIQRNAAKPSFSVIFGHFDDFKAHSTQNFSNGRLFSRIFLRSPTILHGNCFSAAKIFVRKLFVAQNQFPKRFSPNFGVSLLKNRRTVVTNRNHR